VVVVVLGGLTSLSIGIADLISSSSGGWSVARSILLIAGGALLLSVSPLLWRRRLQ
jgi:hypothetical protein